MSHFMRPSEAPPVNSPEEAATLMVHHLIMAAIYFELTADDRGRAVDQIITDRCNDLAAPACLMFNRMLVNAYEAVALENEPTEGSA
jgi:hypothetical protein